MGVHSSQTGEDAVSLWQHETISKFPHQETMQINACCKLHVSIRCDYGNAIYVYVYNILNSAFINSSYFIDSIYLWQKGYLFHEPE